MLLNDMAYIIAIAIEILLPIILAIILWKKFKVSWAIFFLGMVLFLAKITGGSKVQLTDESGNIIQSKYTQAQNQTQLNNNSPDFSGLLLSNHIS